MNDREYEAFRFRLNAVDEKRSELNEYELGFLTNTIARVKQYQAKVKISAKQMALLEKLYARLYPSSKEAAQRGAGQRDLRRDNVRRRYL